MSNYKQKKEKAQEQVEWKKLCDKNQSINQERVIRKYLLITSQQLIRLLKRKKPFVISQVFLFFVHESSWQQNSS